MVPLRPASRTEYALKTLFALRSSTGPVSSRELAALRDIPPRFIEHVLADLKAAGLVLSRRGKHGGYRLARALDDITLGDVLRLTEKLPEAEQKHPSSRCAIQECWQGLARDFSKRVDAITIAELSDRSDVLTAQAPVTFVI